MRDQDYLINDEEYTKEDLEEALCVLFEMCDRAFTPVVDPEDKSRTIWEARYAPTLEAICSKANRLKRKHRP